MGLWEKVMPRDIIAMLLIVGGLILKFQGSNGVISSILIAIVAFYFGAEILKSHPRV